ncbi:MAG: hypothetical protein A2007_01635 [Verrucomicrobia bacterium GWC2_42_7]|nr:MAG: hypothetical protein A2007_01635 [Verrucomicrobia bacterium GWC2_42_7]
MSIAIMVILCLLLSVILSQIVNPIRRVAFILKDIAEGEGDLRKRLDSNSKDELGELAKWFNVFVEKLQVLITKISKDTELLTVSSKGLEEKSKELFCRSKQVSEKSTNANSEGIKLSQNIKIFVNSADQISGSINNMAAASEEMASASQNVASSIRQWKNLLATSQSIVKENHQ